MIDNIRNGQRTVNGVKIETKKGEIYNCNILGVEVGTNGYQGGDTGHGSRTYIRIEDLGSTDINAWVDRNKFNETESVTIKLGGDTELYTIIEALKFITETLEEQAKEE